MATSANEKSLGPLVLNMAIILSCSSGIGNGLDWICSNLRLLSCLFCPILIYRSIDKWKESATWQNVPQWKFTYTTDVYLLPMICCKKVSSCHMVMSIWFPLLTLCLRIYVHSIPRGDFGRCTALHSARLQSVFPCKNFCCMPNVNRFFANATEEMAPVGKLPLTLAELDWWFDRVDLTFSEETGSKESAFLYSSTILCGGAFMKS